MSILSRIEMALRRSGMSPSRFGRMVANDPSLVRDLRVGRQVGPGLQRRIDAQLRSHEVGAVVVTLVPGER